MQERQWYWDQAGLAAKRQVLSPVHQQSTSLTVKGMLKKHSSKPAIKPFIIDAYFKIGFRQARAVQVFANGQGKGVVFKIHILHTQHAYAKSQQFFLQGADKLAWISDAFKKFCIKGFPGK